MGFVKVVKNTAYFKRYQVPYRRRREGKTDYQARRKMVKQGRDKYNTPKYRLVVRRSNRYWTCQIVYATITGDRVVTSARSSELPNYGFKTGLANFAAAYATGLLVARRLLNKLGLEDSFDGVEEVDGEEYHIEEEVDEDERQPFKAILDVGLARTTVGAKIFAAMKGAADGGLHIPHTIKKFPGYRAPEERGAEHEYDVDVMRSRIFGGHVSEYMETMEEEDEEKYKAHFSTYIKNGIGADDVEGMIEDVHKAIRENPAYEKKEKKDIKIERRGGKIFDGKTVYPRQQKRSKKERVGRVRAKIQMAQQRLLAAAEESDEE